MALQETHLQEEEKISIQGYEWIEGNRSKQSGGGVGFLVCKNLLRNVIREPSINYPDKMEVRWDSINPERQTTLVYGCVLW